MTPEWISVLPNLSIGVVAVLGIIYITLRFLQALDARADKHEIAMQRREQAIRELEASVRTSLIDHLTQASHALMENTKILSRVIRHLDGDK